MKKKNNTSLAKAPAQGGKGKSLPPVSKKQPKNGLSRRGRILLFILIGVLSLGALVGGFFGIRAMLGYGRDFNYIESDLSRYVTLSAEDLKNIKMTVRVDKPTDADVDGEILALLVQYKTLADGEPNPDAVIKNGSAVTLFYSGYLLADNGSREYFSGGSNLSASATTLVIGSGSFIPGFEEGLVGVRPSDTQVPTVLTEGAIQDGDIVYANLVGFHPNGKAIALYGQRLEISPALDEEYGDGFYSMLVGSNLDVNLCDENTVFASKKGEGDFLYTNIRALYKTEGEKPYTVEGYFPWNYGQDHLNGKTAYFDVYIQDTTTYDLPEFTDAFLTDTVGILAEKLEDYEGNSLTEKYRTYVMETLMADYETRLLDAAEESFWQKIAEIAEVKRVPRAAMLEVYDGYIENMQSTYEEYLANSGYTEAVYPFTTFAAEYLQLESGENYKKHVRELAKQTAGEKMIFFYGIQLLNVAPNEKELSEAYEDVLYEMAKQYSTLDESYYESQTDPEKKQEAYEAYVEAIDKTKAELLNVLGEEYFLESAYYNFSFPKLLSLAKIKYVGRGHSA